MQQPNLAAPAVLMAQSSTVELPAIKIGGRGVGGPTGRRLDASLERLQKETAEWAKAHPLSPRDKGDAENFPLLDEPPRRGQ